MTPQEWIESTKRRWDSGHLYEGAQHLAAALDEISRLSAQVDALRAGVAVVVPELAEYQVDVIESMMRDVEDFEAMKNHLKIGHVHELVAIVEELRAHSVPASRVLKEGEVAVTRSELSPLRIIANHFSRGDREWILEYTAQVEMALDALHKLRSQEGGA